MQGSIQRIAFAALAAVVASVLLAAILGAPNQSKAALVKGGNGAQVIVGEDDDNTDNPKIQPPGTAADQSLKNTDVLNGGRGNDVLIGLLGSDVIQSGKGRDISVGGTEQFTPPNSDIISGGQGNDVNIWAPGDGSDAFLGNKHLDAQVFGVIDRDADNVPTLSDPVPRHPKGVPTADVSGSPGFCTVERVGKNNSLGYDHLVRFFVRSSGNLAVTIRLKDTEQVFCTSKEGGKITFADLTERKPSFVNVSSHKVAKLNQDVAQIIR